MFGQFNPESFDPHSEESVVNFEEVVAEERKKNIALLLDEQVGDKKMLTGGEYARLISLAGKSDISAKELKHYLEEKKITISPGSPSDERFSTIRLA